MTEIAFLDGGLGQEINKRSSAPAAHPLWSIKVMIEDGPDIIKAVHHDYINAGSKVLTVNAYTATPVLCDTAEPRPWPSSVPPFPSCPALPPPRE